MKKKPSLISKKTHVISILIVTYNAETYIENCLNSIIKQNLTNFEIIIIDGHSSDNTVNIIKKYFKPKSIPLKIINNPKKSLASGWNIGVNEANGSYIIRIDAHAEFMPNYIANGLKKINTTPNLAGIGGLLTTKASGYIGSLISTILSNPIGVGNSTFRIGLSKDSITDTIVYGLYKSEIIKQFPFNESLKRNQDLEFHKQIKKQGYQLLTSPELKAIYYSRSTITKFAKQGFENGFWVAYSLTGHLRHWTPMMFLITLTLTAIIIPPAFYITLSTYSLTALIAYLFLSKEFRIDRLLLIIPLTCILHISYGIGTSFGLIKKLLHLLKSFNKIPISN